MLFLTVLQPPGDMPAILIRLLRFLQISSALPTSSLQYSYFPSLSAHKAWVKISEIFPLCSY